MPRCVFLTLAEVLDFVIDDELAYEPLRALGIDVEAQPWDGDVDWSRYDVAVIRSTWDYFHRPRKFLETIERIDRAVKLYNGLDTIRWNIEKTYLLDLERRGVPIVPTLVRDHYEAGDLGDFFETLKVDRIIVKPVISAAALDTFLLSPGDRDDDLVRLFDGRRFLVQPFLPAVTDEGEASLMYIDGTLSHAVRKIPKAGDFRSQEEHGSHVEAFEPNADLRAAADAALAAVTETPLYARADLVRSPNGYVVMELELVEPSLYLRMDDGAAERLARAIHRRIKDTAA